MDRPREGREYHGEKPLVPPEVIERIMRKRKPKPFRAMILRWFKRRT